MKQFRGAWSLAGLAAGVAGLGTSYFVAMAMTIRESPVVAVADMVIRLTPGWLAEYLIGLVGRLDKPLLLAGILLVCGLLFAWAGRLSKRSWWAPSVLFGVLALLAGVAVSAQRGATATDVVPVAVGLVTWMVTLSLLTEPLRTASASAVIESDADVVSSGLPPGRDAEGRSRRAFLIRSAIIVVGAGVLGVAGRVVGRGRRHVEETRRLLRLPGVSEPSVPRSARVGLDEVSPWMTPNGQFYLIHTAVIVPAIEPAEWSLRIHGKVDRELTISYAELVEMQFTEAWVTLNCVSNPVGGDLIGNAWWSGVRLAPLLERVGVHPDADAVLQTSEDGWTCGTPLSALTDDRNAMLAVAMNGQPLPIEHGFPVRTIVPGLYGYVSATKWVVDLEVTNFSEVTAYWTERGWGEKGPVKIASRIDVPRSGATVSAGSVDFGGVAWCQHTGISGVEFSVDEGAWTTAQIAAVANPDTWVQWRGSLDVGAGDHTVRVRAIGADGTVQTGAIADVLPDGATGYHISDFSVSDA